MKSGCAPQTSPDPPGESWRHVKRRNAAGSSRIPSRLAHRARPIRQYQADATLSRLLPPSPATPGSGCLQLHPAAATARRWTVSHLHPEQQRLVAHPRPCQNRRKTAVASGHSRTSRTASDLGMGWLTRCVKHTSKQPVTSRQLNVAELSRMGIYGPDAAADTATGRGGSRGSRA
jgi:hypothetical protein